MRPHTAVLPKPLIPLGDESIIERVLRGLRAGGIEDVTVSLGYLGHLVQAVIDDGARFGLTVTYTREPEPLGTAGALSLFPGGVEDDDLILVVNADTLTDLDFGALLDWFEVQEAVAALVCVERDVLIDYGVVESAPDGRLLGIREKPRMRNTLSTGINLLRGSVVKGLDGSRIDMPDFLVGLATSGAPVLCKVVDSLWMDLGRPEDLLAAAELVERGIV